MRRILTRTVLVTLGSVAGSLGVGALFLPLLGGTFGPVTFWMCVLCPVAVAGPTTFWTELNRRRLADAHGELCRAHEQLAVAHAELADAHARLAERARRDDMTGMLNRESFFAALEAARREAETGTLLIIDADNFKRINDDYGHLAGDKALLLITDAIDATLHTEDLRGRIGGEEFAVFLAGSSPGQSRETAERIRLAVQRIDFRPEHDRRMPLSVSIGGSWHRPAAMVSELMREADSHLYAAKRAGRNRVVFETDAVKAA